MVNISMTVKEIHTSYYGPVKNHWGYVTELAVIDDLMIAKTQTPYQTLLVRYFIDERDLRDHIELLNQDRRY